MLRNPDVRWRTVETLGFAALFARCGDGKGVIESLVTLPVHSLQLSSDADLLRCFRSDEHRDSKLNFPFSVDEKISGFNQATGSNWIAGESKFAFRFCGRRCHGYKPAILVVMDYWRHQRIHRKALFWHFTFGEDTKNNSGQGTNYSLCAQSLILAVLIHEIVYTE